MPELALGTRYEGVVIRPLRRATEPRHVWVLTRPEVAATAAVAATVSALRYAAREHEKRIARRPHVAAVSATG